MMFKNISVKILYLFIFIFNLTHSFSQDRILLNNKADSLLKDMSVEKEFSFVVFGDAQRWDTLHLVPEVFSEMLEDIKNNQVKPKFVIMVGDFVYTGTYHQYDTFYNLISAWMDSTGIGFFCLPGNHNFTGAIGYNNYLNFIDEDLDYYFDYGDNRFVLINNINSLVYYNYNIKQEQIDKVKVWLDNATGKIFSFSHVSLARNEHSSGTSNPGYGQYLNQLENAGFTAHFNGHIHDYHRTTYNDFYHITTAGAGGYQIGTYNPPHTYDNHHWLLVNIDACEGVSVNMYRHNYGNDSIAKQYDFYIKPSQNITIQPEIKHASCFGNIDGSISIVADNGVAPGNYTYKWSNAVTTSNVNYLQSGNYTVTITDSTGCYTIASYTIEEPDEISIIALTSDVLCASGNDGSIEINVTGGTPPFLYDWSNGASSQSLYNLQTGLYHVTISDSNNCSSTYSASIYEPPAIIINSTIISDTNEQCLASISLNVNGGSPPYNYTWLEFPDNNLSYINNLCNNNYSVTVSDSNGCNKNLSYNINNIWQNVTENYQVLNMSVVPNPASDFIDIFLPAISDRDIEVRLIDIYGKIWYYKKYFNTSKVISLDLTENINGLFFIYVQTKNYFAVEKIIIQ